MSSADLEEWRRLLSLATRPSVKTQIELLISNLEASVLSSNVVEKPQTVTYTTVTSFSWDQTDKFVTVLIPVTGDVTDVHVNCDTNSLDVKFTSGSKHYQLYLKKLYSRVVKDAATWKFKSGFLQVKMEKDNKMNWSSLTGSPEKDKKMPPMPKGDDSNPQAMLMDMMKNLYNEGDDEMKRTMMKAWTETMSNKDKLKF